MKKLLKLKNILIGSAVILVVLLVIEFQDTYRKHGKFRTTLDPVFSIEAVDLTGLRDLKVAGGPIMPLDDLKRRLKLTGTNLILVDGIIGNHGYAYGIPISYLGYANKFPSAENIFWRVFYTGTFFTHPEKVVSEADEVKKYGFGYAAFQIGSKYTSSDQTMDEFVKFLDTLPPDVWVYFHCHHGKGRTSMMIVFADIMKNAPKVALKDIVRRQYLLGSVDLFDTTPWTGGTYAAATLENRKKYVEKFYEFVCQRKAGGIQLWSEWHRQHQAKGDSFLQSGVKP